MDTETTNWMISYMAQVVQGIRNFWVALINSAFILIPLFFLGILFVYVLSSIKIINEGNEGLVERLGEYRRTLRPGLNWVIPLIDVVLVESTREQILDVDPQSAISHDRVELTADAVIYWKILDIKKAYYAIEDLEAALENLVFAGIRAGFSQIEIRKIDHSRSQINQALLEELNLKTKDWGVQVTRVEIQGIYISKKEIENWQLMSSAENEKSVAAVKAQSRTKAYEEMIRFIIESMGDLSGAIPSRPYAKEILQFVLAGDLVRDYIEANYRLATSDNSKVVFMDPKLMSKIFESLSNLSNFDVSSDSEE